jgi:hypothetical protein
MNYGVIALDADEVTLEEQLLIEEWLNNGFNKKEAYESLHPGLISKKHGVVYKIFAKPGVQKYAREQIILRGMDKYEAIANLAAKARGSVTDYMNEDGTWDLKKLKANKDGLVKKIKITKRPAPGGGVTEEVSIEFYDAIRAQEVLLKAQGDLVDKTAS